MTMFAVKTAIPLVPVYKTGIPLVPDGDTT